MMSLAKNTLSHANQRVVTVESTLDGSWKEFYGWQQSMPTAKNYVAESLLSTYFDIQDYETESCTVSQELEEVLTVLQLDSFPPISPYETFPLTDRNVYHGDEAELLPFRPYSDDEMFNYLDFLDSHYTDDAFEWKTMKDPNRHMIILHATWQLLEHHGLSFEEIDATGILPECLLSGNNTRFEPGLLANSARRDYLPWPNLKLPSYNALRKLETQVKEVVGIFCNNLNCLLAWCPTHLEPSSVPGQAPAKYPSHNFFTLYEPCGEDCFRFSDASDDTQEIGWVTNEALILELCLRVLPDAAPCNLARSCHQPCREVFARRRHLVPDSSIPAPSKRPKRKRCKDIIHDWQEWAANSPCSHIGISCETAGDACPCIANDALCQAACRCVPFPCERRQIGCRCTKQDCRNEKKCRCARAKRECDPAVCRTCGIHDIASGKCANGSIQRGIWKSLEIKECPWGRGAFSREHIHEGEFISEYVGEIFLPRTADTREMLARHRGRNYLFKLELDRIIDCAFVGNETRYINHSIDNANCVAEVWFVNGEHRIGFWATKDIAEGDEILFDYGGDFPLDTSDTIVVD